MPDTFKDETIRQLAKVMEYRSIGENESLAEYRAAIADLHQGFDPLEAHEIRTGKGWREWDSAEFDDLVSRSPETLSGNPVVVVHMARRGGHQA